MPHLIAARCKMGITISAWRLGGFAGDYCGDIVSIRKGEGTGSIELERISFSDYERRGFDIVFLTHWRDESGFIPFTIMKRRKGKYFPDVLSFIPAGKNLVKITGRNGRYTVKYN